VKYITGSPTVLIADIWNCIFTSFVVGQPVIDLGELETLVVQDLLKTGLGRLRADLVILVRRSLYGIHCGDAVLHLPAKARRAHLGHANVLGPGNHLRLPGPELIHLEVSARTLQTMILQYFPGLLPVGQTGELGVPRRAQLQAPNAKVGHILAQPGKIAVLNSLPMRIRLAPDGYPKRIPMQSPCGRAEQPRRSDIRRRSPDKLSSRSCRHAHLLMNENSPERGSPFAFRPDTDSIHLWNS